MVTSFNGSLVFIQVQGRGDIAFPVGLGPVPFSEISNLRLLSVKVSEHSVKSCTKFYSY